MALMRYDPFREMDRFTEQLFGSGSPARAPFMPMDAVRREDRVEIVLDVPGVAPDAIDVSVERNVLTVKADRAWWPAEGDEILGVVPVADNDLVVAATSEAGKPSEARLKPWLACVLRE